MLLGYTKTPQSKVRTLCYRNMLFIFNQTQFRLILRTFLGGMSDNFALLPGIQVINVGVNMDSAVNL